LTHFRRRQLTGTCPGVQIFKLSVVSEIPGRDEPEVVLDGQILVCTDRLTVDVHDVAAPLIDGKLSGHQEKPRPAGDRLRRQGDPALLVGGKRGREHAGIGARNQHNKDQRQGNCVRPQGRRHRIVSSRSSHGVISWLGVDESSLEYTGTVWCCKLKLVLSTGSGTSRWSKPNGDRQMTSIVSDNTVCPSM